MTKKEILLYKILVLLGIVVIIFLSFVLYRKNNQEQRTPVIYDDGAVQDADRVEESIIAAGGLLEAGAVTGYASEETCLSGGSDQEVCTITALQETARTQSDLSACDELASFGEKSVATCRQLGQQARARNTRDLDVCAQTGDLAPSCRLAVVTQNAVESRDLSTCDVLDDDASKQGCRDTVAAQVARNLGDPAWCASIGTEEVRVICERGAQEGASGENAAH